MILRWMSQWLSREPALPPHPVAGPVTRATAIRHIEELLARRYAEAMEHARYSERPTDPGWRSLTAVQACQSIVKPWPEGETAQAYFQRILQELAALAEDYGNDPDDHEAYSLRTVRDIENDITVIARSCHAIEN